MDDRDAGRWVALIGRVERVGKRLGNYQLMRLLGSGSVADVYLGEHVFLSTQAAIKVMHTAMTLEEIQNFVHEAHTIVELRHPHIVRILDVGVDGQVPFLVMDFAPQGTLRQLHVRGSILPLETIISYSNQIALALQHAHDHKLVHQAIKPENMLVDGQHSILLSDFGIALAGHKMPALVTQEAIETVAYMAPEQMYGQARPASDQYALAAVIYEWLIGVRLFDSMTALEIMLGHLNVPPVPLAVYLPSISSSVEQVILTALEKDPRRRFPSIRIFAQALEQAAQGRAFTALTSPMAIPTSISSVETAEGATLVLPAISLMPTGPNETFSGHLFLPTSGRLLHTYDSHTRSLQSTVWSSSGAHLVLGGEDGVIHLLSAGKSKHVIKHSSHLGAVKRLAWAPQGEYFVAVYKDWSLELLDAHTTDILLYRSGIEDASWSPDGVHLAVVGYPDYSVTILHALYGHMIWAYKGHTDAVHAVAWSPLGTCIASASEDGTIHLWNATTGQTLRVDPYPSNFKVSALYWSPDGTKLAAISSNNVYVRIWDAFTGRDVAMYRGHADTIYSLSWSSDGLYIASTSADKTIQIWRTATGSLLFTHQEHSSHVTTAQWSPDGKCLVSAGTDGLVRIWQVR